MVTDTIAAIATGMTDAGISIIRISGENALEIADRIFRAKSGKKLSEALTHTMHFGVVVEDTTEIDEVLVSVMRAPRSYTGENTVEVNCHGGMYLANRILSLVLKNGARLAEPGEFTKRAFLNGKLDLSEAEAVMDLISSKNDFAARNSMQQLKGNIYRKVKSLREDILYEIAYIESALDDPEHFDLTDYPGRLAEKVDGFLLEIDGLKRASKNGRIRKEGIRTVIVGKPNAGKSSFLNLLTGEDRAIVTSTAGTTRDILEETIRLDDIILNVVDTAGIRETQDEVEKIGVEKARKYAAEADLVLYMVDSSVPLDEDDREIISLVKEKNVIILMNKSDLEARTSIGDVMGLFQAVENSYLSDFSKEKDRRNRIVSDVVGQQESVSYLLISAKEQQGLEEFTELLKKKFYTEKLDLNEDIVITNLRQLNELDEVYKSLQLVLESIQAGMPEDFFSIDLNNAYLHLGFIIGEEMNDDVVDEIFSKFCMGK